MQLGDLALFAHGHVLRVLVLVARWLARTACWRRTALPARYGHLCVLGYYRDIPAVKIWNGPLND
jgi:hypothetical protein